MATDFTTSAFEEHVRVRKPTQIDCPSNSYQETTALQLTHRSGRWCSCCRSCGGARCWRTGPGRGRRPCLLWPCSGLSSFHLKQRPREKEKLIAIRKKPSSFRALEWKRVRKVMVPLTTLAENTETCQNPYEFWPTASLEIQQWKWVSRAASWGDAPNDSPSRPQISLLQTTFSSGLDIVCSQCHG